MAGRMLGILATVVGVAIVTVGLGITTNSPSGVQGSTVPLPAAPTSHPPGHPPVSHRTVLAAANSTVRVPAFLNGSPSGVGPCPPPAPGCGYLGVTSIAFNVTSLSALNGTLTSNTSVQLILANGTEIANLRCGFQVPACFGNPQFGPGYAHYIPSPWNMTASVNFSGLQLNLSGPTNLVTPGSWVLYILNWSLSPAVIDVGQAIVVG
jgi:hypothetical protein